MKNPVFIFSAGPACGVKLVQQLISSSHEVMVWTAPAGALNHILEAIRLTDMSLSPGVMGVLAGTSKGKVEKKLLKPNDDPKPHVANMRFSVKHMQRSFQQLFSSLYGAPAAKFGFQSWGVADHTGNKQTCDMLRMIYPNARFVFVIRHPVDCLRAIKKIGLRPRDRWGRLLEEKNAIDWFAANWAAYADDFYGVPHVFNIRYEHLVSGKLEIAALNTYLGTNLSAPAQSMQSMTHDLPDNISVEKIAKIKLKIADQMAKWNYQ